VTIKDISAQTGYSVGTVSRVLNHQPNVSEKARKAILEVAEAVGFQLNANAKQLKQQRPTSILAVVKGTSNELFSDLIEAMQAKIQKSPYPLIIDYIDEDADEVQRGIQLCREKKPLGMIFLGGNTESFRRDFDQIDVPCVLVTGDASSLELEGLSSVTTDDTQAGFLAVEHLVKLGHRKILVIGGSRDISEISRLRFDGCMRAFQKENIAFNPELDYATGRFSFADGYRAMEELLERKREFTAVFAMADVMAIGAIRALKDHGLRVPEDVSVIGLDGLAMGDYTVPKLATVRQSVEELSERSIQMLASQIEGKSGTKHVTITPIVEENESASNI
jgi:LacI family transcriptional regulator